MYRSTWDAVIHPLADIAEGLERHGHYRAAAIAYGLAYVRTRGGGGWLTMGDTEHEQTLLQGIALGRNEALEAVATEIAYLLRNISFNAGISRHLIERAAAWGEPQVAKECWWTAYEVIKHRLPTNTSWVAWFELFDTSQIPDWSVDEGLVAVLFGRINHPILYRKIAAIAGISRAIVLRPDAISRPLHAFLTRDATVSSLLLVLYVLRIFEQNPFPITKANSEILTDYAASELWGPRVLAQMLLERAGLSAPTCVRDVPYVQGINLSEDRIEGILSADVGNRFAQLRKIWPDLPQLFARRLHGLLQSSVIHKERCKDRYELAYGRDGNLRPPNPVLGWEKELFETALHETLNGIYPHLWLTGRWYNEIDQEILALVMPNIIGHIAIHASRTARPPYPDPETITETHEERDVMTLDDDRLCLNWRRVGYVERQWIRDNTSKYGPPTVCVQVFAGIMREKSNSTEFPFQDADIMNWWVTNTPPPEFPPSLPSGPLIRLTRLRDLLGDALILVPPIELRTYINLHPAKYGSRLMWWNSDGEPAVVFRTWRVRDEEQLDGETVRYVGSDLLMHPDIFSRMESLAGTNLQEVCVIWRTSLDS